MKKIILASLFVLISALGANDDISMTDMKEYKEYVNSIEKDAYAIELWQGLKELIKENPNLDEATKIVNSNLLYEDTINNILHIDIQILEKVVSRINKTDFTVTDEILNKIAENTKNTQIQNMCLDPYSMIGIDKGIKYVYTYVTQNNGVSEFLIEFKVNKEVCDNFNKM